MTFESPRLLLAPDSRTMEPNTMDGTEAHKEGSIAHMGDPPMQMALNHYGNKYASNQSLDGYITG